MAKTSGRFGSLEVSAGESTLIFVGELTSLEYSESHETEDATTFDSGGYKQSDYGSTQAALSATWQRDEADAGQDLIRAANEKKERVQLRYRPFNNPGQKQKLFWAKINSLSVSNAQNEKVQETAEFESTGAITTDTQEVLP